MSFDSKEKLGFDFGCANNALMLAQAGLAIACNAKNGLDRSANVALCKSSMTDILQLLGITEEDISEALACKAA